MKTFKILLAVLFLLALTVPVYAQSGTPPDEPGGDVWTNTQVEVHPELGPTVPNQTPGVNGYKVFYPGAIKKVQVTQTGNKNQVSAALLSATTYRSGYTDAFNGIFLGVGKGWQWGGSHTSDSDLVETQIWVDGTIKYNGDTGWRNSCPQHTTGQRATCNTSFIGSSNWPFWSSYAESKHFFHTSGNTDSNFTTGDYGY